ncbi:MAG TPA: hypothetical protein VKV74_12240 [Bryobacteraceae bacterium]|nr:hypothetical protein [Bryobacteraceae bacterium]
MFKFIKGWPAYIFRFKEGLLIGRELERALHQLRGNALGQAEFGPVEFRQSGQAVARTQAMRFMFYLLGLFP